MNAKELKNLGPGTRIITRAGNPGTIKDPAPRHAPAFALVTMTDGDWMIACGDMELAAALPSLGIDGEACAIYGHMMTDDGAWCKSCGKVVL